MAAERISPSRVRVRSAVMPQDEQSLNVSVAPFVCGALCCEPTGYGRVRPQRFLSDQRRALGSCLAWYPGIFKQMAACTSGVRLEFSTDSQHIDLAITLDAEPKVTRNVLEHSLLAGGEEPTGFDGIAVVVDGVLVQTVALYSDTIGDINLSFDLDNSTDTLGQNSAGCLPLPGMGDSHQVCIYLPAHRGCELGYLQGDGTYALSLDDKPSLVVFGDSIAQGFIAASPVAAWPQRVATALNLDLYNQSIAAQVFQPSSLSGLDAVADELKASYVVVALGTNYHLNTCAAGLTGREITHYFKQIDALFNEVPLLVLLPDTASFSPVAQSCFAQVPELIETAVQGVREKRMQEGRPAVLVSKTPSIFTENYFADYMGHPTAEGHAYLANFVLEELAKLDCACLREFGVFGRCGACTKDINS